jgi:hypothetical protein
MRTFGVRYLPNSLKRSASSMFLCMGCRSSHDAKLDSAYLKHVAGGQWESVPRVGAVAVEVSAAGAVEVFDHPAAFGFAALREYRLRDAVRVGY